MFMYTLERWVLGSLPVGQTGEQPHGRNLFLKQKPDCEISKGYAQPRRRLYHLSHSIERPVLAAD